MTKEELEKSSSFFAILYVDRIYSMHYNIV